MDRFVLDVPSAALDDLRDRLRRTRWPEPATAPGWTQGVPVEYLRDLCRYWAEEYDWPARQARLNAYPQFRTEIDGLNLHFLHVRAPRPDAPALILTHGWPGSVVEFRHVLGPLSETFHVVCPSLPGYGFSDRPTRPGWGVERTARAWAGLMTRLGYERFAAQGHDWGTSVSTSLGQQFPDRILGLHLVPPLVAPDPDTFGDLTATERSALDDLERSGDGDREDGDGYSHEQATRPQTLGYGLVDSPAALCAWIIEKFHAWSDCGGDLDSVFARDDLLDNLMFYWLPGTGASAARFYWESFRGVRQIFREGTGDTVSVPVGCSIFPRENPRPSRRWAARRFTDIRYWSEPERGGHFAAFEQPEIFLREVRACFAALL
ncbi:epoxide hydrolase family protein [Hamadaea tsunoensis]|uniref:epoxide hydrolase family protein n=1 Tax=Hamadaea tsunoensis TaxID=53368 RepID=UPI0003FA6969|nr:epoxide hydrolase family protein [Hamadaea tsunoensis]